MPKFTIEQQKAIDTEGSNIIVSAGAGSGKTAVLTERVIRKIKSGVDINKLLVLTFTKDAAHEMKDRIRASLKKEGLKEALDYIDSSYITTFDSYALSIVKKYFYLLNVSEKTSIMDSSIVTVYKNKIIDQIFEEFYEKEDFKEFIDSYTVKKDDDIKKLIISISNKMDSLLNKDQYLDKYIENYYSEAALEKTIALYQKEIFEKFDKFRVSMYNFIDISDEKLSLELNSIFRVPLELKSYDNIKKICELKIPKLPPKSSENIKEQKEICVSLIDELTYLTRFESIESIKNQILNTKENVSVIIEIIKLIDKKVNEFKKEFDRYEFNDIALLAIKVVKENPEVREELSNYYNEIMIDEYQDTSDLQEEFINLISNNNVYSVGDIKQSIYRFRNANPYLFRDKYDAYNKGKGGIKIDLLKNFRSRNEVINDINKIFSRIMSLTLGDAAYEESHNMIFGNTDYEASEKLNNNNIKIFTYDNSESEEKKEEIEAFIVAKDIKEKIDSNYKIYDKETCHLRDVTYSDFAILIDRSLNFSVYKKVFEYLNLPLSINKDEVLTEENEILIIKNIINLIIKIKEKKYDKEFRYYMTSILRSFVFKESDAYIFSLFKNNAFYDCTLFDKLTSFADKFDELTPYELIELIYKEFNIYEATILVGNIEESFIRYEYILKISASLTEYGYTIRDFAQYLNEMLKSEIEIKYEVNTRGKNAIKLMTIHKSKGLEFPICYYTGLYKTFNKKALNDMFIFNNDLGIILPFVSENIEDNISKDLLKIRNNKEDISEKIRLLYVSLTRAREKIILVMPSNEIEENNSYLVSEEVKIKYNSFLSMFNSIKSTLLDSIEEKKVDDLNISSYYSKIKSKEHAVEIDLSEDKVDNFTNEIKYEKVSTKKFSKESNKLINQEERTTMDYGIEAHYILETTDFMNPDNEYAFSLIDKIPNLKNAKIYKEYEFIYEEDNTVKHGVIDLLIEYETEIYIIDYKLSNIDDENYNKQLEGYKHYINQISEKSVSIYLYSINNKTLKKLS